MTTQTDRVTPLYNDHVALGGRMVPFAGYLLPVQYAGIIQESQSVRQEAGMFDVSHMARLRLTGPNVVEYLEKITVGDVRGLLDGQGHYSMLPNERGGLVDDIIVYRLGENEFRMVVNAANHAKDLAWMNQQNTFDVTIEDQTDQTAMIAVQGPSAGAIVGSLSDNSDEMDALPFFSASVQKIAGVPCFAPRSGYTGEDGFELICPNDQASKLWQALYEAGVAPCGLGSRDTLRVEAGLPLYGHELSDDRSPIEAGLGWAIRKTGGFIGAEIIDEARAKGTPYKLQGIRLASKRLPLPGMKVLMEGEVIGEVSSGIFSPLLGCGAAFAFLKSEIKSESQVQLDIRGTMEPGTVVNKRFYRRVKSSA